MKKYNIKVTACVNELNTFNSMPSFRTLNKNYIIEAKDKEDAKQKGREQFIAETLYKGSIYGEYTGERRVAPFMEGFADDHPGKYEDITRRDYFEYRWSIDVYVKQYRKPRTKPEAEATAETTEATAETTEATAETTEATAETTEATAETAEATAETTEATAETAEATAETTEETEQKEGSYMKNYEVKAIIEAGAECVDIVPDDTEIMADSAEEAIDCVICDLMEQATYSDYNAERYGNYKLVIYDHNNNVICVYKFKARLTFDNKEIEGAEWEDPEYCDTVTDTTEEAKKDISKKYEAEGLTEAGQWVPLFNDLIDNAETDTDALNVARGRMLKKGLDVSVRVRAYYYNRITGEGCYSHSWTEQPKAEETAQTAETTEETAQTTETTEATAQTTEATAQPTEETAQTTEETTEATAETTEATAQTTEATAQTTETTEATAQTTEATAETTETTTHYRTGRGILAESGRGILSEAFHRATKSTPPPPIISTGEEVTGVTIREHRQYNNGIEKVIVHKGFYNFDELISWYQHNDPSFLCTYKGILFGCDNVDYYASSFIYESEYL